MRDDNVWMKLMVLALLLVGCTKPNPDRCCTDEADCAALGIPNRTACDDGLLCRGHQCISIPCTTSAGCDVSAPYCVDDTCAEACLDDSQCPGFTEQGTFCADGICIDCRDSYDCTAPLPVCRAGMCGQCFEHSECASGACALDGTCADESEIAYVDLAGSAGSDCTRLSPCSTVTRALALVPARKYVVIAGGTYSASTELVPVDERWFIGGAGAQVTLTRSTPGTIIHAHGPVVVHLANLTLADATNSGGGGAGYGTGLYCDPSLGSPTVDADNVTFTANQTAGLFGTSCNVDVHRSAFSACGGGVELTDSNATFDECAVTDNSNTGMTLDSGVYTVTNTLVARNGTGGINLNASTSAQRIEFNTIVDNSGDPSVYAGITCGPSVLNLANNIVARNPRQTRGQCTYTGSIVVDSDISGLAFKSPDVEPYDYHLTAGSIAIDMAVDSTIDHDMDGDARPQGAGRDVGADEFVP